MANDVSNAGLAISLDIVQPGAASTTSPDRLRLGHVICSTPEHEDRPHFGEYPPSGVITGTQRREPGDPRGRGAQLPLNH